MLTHNIRVEANYSYFFLRIADIGDATEMPRAALEQARRAGGGLVATWTGGAVLLTGSHTGNMTIELEAWDAEPPAAAPEWEEQAEVSYESTTGLVYFLDIWGSKTGTEPERLRLPRGAADYRLRAHARGREAARAIQGVADHAEAMLLQFWPA